MLYVGLPWSQNLRFFLSSSASNFSTWKRTTSAAGQRWWGFRCVSGHQNRDQNQLYDGVYTQNQRSLWSYASALFSKMSSKCFISVRQTGSSKDKHQHSYLSFIQMQGDSHVIPNIKWAPVLRQPRKIQTLFIASLDQLITNKKIWEETQTVNEPEDLK